MSLPITAARPPRALFLLAAAALAAGCRTVTPVPAAPGVSQSVAAVTRYDPSRALGQLFQDVQLSGLFPDSKTFVDARPLFAPAEIAARYAAAKGTAGFSLRAFVEQYFELPRPVGEGFHSDTSRTMEEHIRALWPVLTRMADRADPNSSLIPLPNPYVVPGGRFREVYYWDSYFTMLGLVESGRIDLVKSMLDNFAHLVRTVGHIPNGNRTYYLSRSQPPFFAAMVGLYATATDTARSLIYLEALEAEHAFWMDGASRVAPGEAYRRVVRLRDGSVLNRYWDDRADPRPESFRPDHELGMTLPVGRRDTFYRHTRAAAESGWDFSSRWMRDPNDLRTLETTDLVPVDLNSLLYHAERTIAAFRRYRGQPGDADVARRFAGAAEERRRALLAASYDPVLGFFFDVRWRTGERVIDRPTLAAAAPLYFGLATSQQARAVAARLERDFLKAGGFVTTTFRTGQQWDAPNGWPPLQWLSIQGVRRYGFRELANTARDRWLALNQRTYRSTGKMTEKYDVLDPSRPAGGGEYPNQDGFGWTNGVALALAAQARAGAAPAPQTTRPERERSAMRTRGGAWEGVVSGQRILVVLDSGAAGWSGRVLSGRGSDTTRLAAVDVRGDSVMLRVPADGRDAVLSGAFSPDGRRLGGVVIIGADTGVAAFRLARAGTPEAARLLAQPTRASPGPRRSHQHPDSARLITSDIPLFWDVLARAPADSLEDWLDREYLARGTDGLRDFIPGRILSGAELALQIRRQRARYEAARPATLRVPEAEPGIRGAFRALKALYPEAVFPDVYFVIGRFNSGGTASPNGLLIGAEMYSDPSRLPAIVAHELIHFQQAPYQGPRTLLAQAFREGAADFVGEMISGVHINSDAHRYGRAHERELWREFKERMREASYAGWLYGKPPGERPADLGYFIGYRIAEAYYARAADKRAALRDIIRGTDVESILTNSGYDP